MGTNFTDIATSDPVVAATINNRLDELDTAIQARAASTSFPLENIFINGGMDIWQRSTDDTAVTTTRKYVADRWAVTTGAGTLAHVLRSTTVRTGGRSKYSMELTGATGVTTVDIDQRIEAALQGWYKQTLYFSAYVYNGSGAAFTPTLYVTTPSAADDWTSSTVRNGGGSGQSLQSCADGAWTLVYWTADVSGYTNIANGLGFRLRVPSGSLVSGDTVRLTEANLVVAAVATPFIPRPIATELLLCQRYYEKSYNVETAPGASTTVGIVCLQGQNAANTVSSAVFKAGKRTTPTVTRYDAVGNVNVVSWINSANAQTNNQTGASAALVYAGASGFAYRDAVSTATSYLLHYTADAEL